MIRKILLAVMACALAASALAQEPADAAAPVAAAPTSAKVRLMCEGTVRTSEAETTNVMMTNSYGAAANAMAQTSRAVTTPGLARIEIDGEASRIVLPSGFAPSLLSARSDAGWRPLQISEMSDARVVGKVPVSVLTKPTVTIDRQTGTISITGLVARFQGACQLDTAPAAKLF